MNVTEYAARIEADLTPTALERARRDVLSDPDLDEQDRGFLTGRIGTYLADRERELGSGVDPDLIGEEA